MKLTILGYIRRFSKWTMEYRSKEFDQWCYLNRIKEEYARSGKPTDNTNIESFDRTFGIEFLNTHCVPSEHFGHVSKFPRYSLN